MPTVDLVTPGGAFSPGAVGDGVANDTPAIVAFNDWAQVQTSPITLTCGVGSKTFLFSGADTDELRAGSPAYGVSQPLTIVGNGRNSTIFKAPGAHSLFYLGCTPAYKSGNSHFGSVNSWTARLVSVGSGSKTLTCKTAGDAAQFSANTYALIGGLDMQSGGDPPNHFYYEFVYITAIDAGAGTITVQDPIVNTYLSTWPNYLGGGIPGGAVDRGGPATLYALNPAWNMDVTYRSMQFNCGDGQSIVRGRKVAFNDVLWTGGNAPTLSVIQSLNFANCDYSDLGFEVDKWVSEVVIDNSVNMSLSFQSSVDKIVVKNNSSIKSNGTPRRMCIENSSVSSPFFVGTIAFGRTEAIRATNSSFGGWALSPLYEPGEITGVFTTDYSMSGGVLKINKSLLPAYGVRWAIPGTWCFWALGSFSRYGPMFQVREVWDDATFVYIRTNLTGGFPAGVTGITVHPCTDAIFSNCTGVSQATNLTNAAAVGFRGKPMLGWTSTAFNGSNMGVNGTGTTVGLPDMVVGKLVSYTINVTTPYTGAPGTLTWAAVQQFANNAVVKPDFSFAVWAPFINLRQAGIRVITPTQVTFNGTPGTGGAGDTGMAYPDPNGWLAGALAGGLGANVDVSAEYNASPGPSGVGPIFTVTAITDPGITAAPRSFSCNFQ